MFFPLKLYVSTVFLTSFNLLLKYYILSEIFPKRFLKKVKSLYQELPTSS